MISVFLREQKRYTQEDLVKEFHCSEEKTVRILKRLKEAGYVETYLLESASGPARKYYHLTDTGKLYQQEKKQEWLDFVGQVNRLLSDC